MNKIPLNDEPSVLDYVKALLDLKRKGLPHIPYWNDSEIDPETNGREEFAPKDTASPTNEAGDESNGQELVCSMRSVFPWRSMLMMVLLLIAQRGLEPPTRTKIFSIILFSISTILFIWAVLSKEWELIPLKHQNPFEIKFEINWKYFIISIISGLMAVILFFGNRFNLLNISLWAISILFIVRTFKDNSGLIGRHLEWSPWSLIEKISSLKLTPWGLLLIITVLVVLFFRISRLIEIPNEMFSDHAEKLQDVQDILNGENSIFFPRNTGREAIQMYLTAAVSILFGTGLSFTSLKIGTVLAGLGTLPFIYLLGKEISNRWVGILAMGLAGIAYWPNVISRIGLRFPLYPLFVAPTLYYLIRGFKQSKRNDFIISGIFLGLGMHGYSPFRIVPILVLIAFVLFIVDKNNKADPTQTAGMLLVVTVTSIALFLPLLSYFIEAPDLFSFRALSRLGTLERPLPEPGSIIFIKNLWSATVMNFWDNGNIWVHSIPGRPALDVVSAVFYFIGTLYMGSRYIKYKNWIDLLIIISVPVLMLPSILSLAFPEENPAMNRLSGAIVPVFIITATGFEALMTNFRRKTGKTLVSIIVILLMTWSITQNYSLVFNQFNKQYRGGSWNTSEIGGVISDFIDLGTSKETVYVIPYPHWVDTRLTGINAGLGVKDMALSKEYIIDTVSDPRSKLFIVNTLDIESVEMLDTLFPSGIHWQYKSNNEGKDFLVFFIPGKKILN